MKTQGQEKHPDMMTQYIKYESDPDLDIPAQLIAQGEIVAFPTETVYGLGASATNVSAIRKIYLAKGRPQDNPLIVHVAHPQDIKILVKKISPLAQCLIDAFMPGPITLVMPKSDLIPNEVSAGLDTVGIRIPGNPIARALIEKSGVPVAAPSANVSGRPSPTQAAHVYQDLNGKIACVLDAGPCEVGLESSVVDVTGDQPYILRPGVVTLEMIADACQKSGININIDIIEKKLSGAPLKPKSPGLKYRHYAPAAQVQIIKYKDRLTYAQKISKELDSLKCMSSGLKTGVFCSKETEKSIREILNSDKLYGLIFYIYDGQENVQKASQSLFAAFRALDDAGVNIILTPGFEKKGQGIAYMNRLEKASEIQQINENLDECNVIKKVLFVCTGNTCRSPMAEAIMLHIIQKESPFVLLNSFCNVQIIVSSAGVFATEGQPVAPHARKALDFICKECLSGHQSRALKEYIVEENDIIFAVTEEHAHIMRSYYPDFSDKIFALKEFAQRYDIFSGRQEAHTNIPDPYGRDLIVYEQTAAALYDIIEALFPFILTKLGVQKKNR